MERRAMRSDYFLFSFAVLFLTAFPVFTGGQAQPTELIAAKQLLIEASHGNWALREGPGDTLYILNRSVKPPSSVWVTDYSGSSARMIVGASGSGELQAPRDLTVDRDGNAIVLNGDGLVKIFSPEGKQLSSFQTERTQALAVLSDGRILVSGFPEEHLMSVYSREGKLLAEIGEPARVDVPDPFDVRMMNMGRIVVDGEDNIYYIFRNLLTPTVREYTPDGNLVGEWHPKGARLDWAVAQANAEIKKRHENGEHGVSAILTGGAFDASTKTLWVGSDEAVFQLDASGHTMRSFSLTRSDGVPVQAFGLAVNADFLCAAGPLHGTFEFLKPK
jgi:hypothetical protein